MRKFRAQTVADQEEDDGYLYYVTLLINSAGRFRWEDGLELCHMNKTRVRESYMIVVNAAQ